MRKIGILILFITITGCTSYKLNLAFSLIGIYNDEVKVSKLTNNEKEVLFIPMHHIGTKSFYADVNKKVDSLENLGYYFYTERLITTKDDTISFLKLRKITGVPFSQKKIGYLRIFDSVYEGKIKYKKELIDQPLYKDMGIDSLKSKNVDVTTSALIHYYETKYGEIKLEKCEYETTMDKKSKCYGKPVNKKKASDAIVTFRNAHIIDELKNDTHQKIAIIYGANHFIGIKEELLKLGYK